MTATRTRVRMPLRANVNGSRRGAGAIVVQIALFVWFVLSVAPLLWTLSGSFKPIADIFISPPQLVPAHPTLANYTGVLSKVPFPMWLITSLLVASITSALATFLSALAGFGFAKYRFPGEQALFNVVLSSLMIPFAIILVPLFVEVTRLGLGNSYLAYGLPYLLPAFGVFMMRQFIMSVPSELIEAARIDAAGEFRIFVGIVLPLIRPALGALFVWFFLTVYNDFLWPTVIVSDSSRYTLPLGLNSLRTGFSTKYGLVLATTVLAAVPTIVMFIALRRQLVEGLTAGAVKT